MTKVLITGANGFIGKSLYKLLIDSGFDVIGCIRDENSNTLAVQTGVLLTVGTIDEKTDWSEYLAEVDVVIHLSARVHVMVESTINPLHLYRQENVASTENLARQAVKAGVNRFIYLSTIKVNGEHSDKPFKSDDLAAPIDAYAKSKWEAELALNKISAESKLDLVIIRPPLVYGAEVKGNFLRLIKWVKSSLPIPLGCIKNKRSMVNVDNLCDFIKMCILHPGAITQVFLVSDGQDLSTPELIRLIAKLKQKSLCLICFPPSLLNFVAWVFSKKNEFQKLSGSLEVCIKKNRELLDWTPPYSVEEGVRKAIHGK